MTETPLPTGDESPMAPPLFIGRILTVWVLATAFGVLVALLAPRDSRFEWLALAIGVCALVTFALQLGTAQREGFITRTATSIAGSVVIIAVADAVALLVG